MTEWPAHNLAGEERALWLDLEQQQALAILHGASQPSDLAVVIIVGGPQYRVGSHRQFVLLARAVAAAGFPCLRFDYRGMGDSEGAARDFESVDADVAAAISLIKRETGASRVVLWGLCDAASAAMIHAQEAPDLAALIVLNPWVYTEQSEAAVRLKSYYLKRLLNPEFWRKLVCFDVAIGDSLRSLMNYWRQTRVTPGNEASQQRHYIERMLDGLNALKSGIYVILSGDDLTAKEFEQLLGSSAAWSSTYKRKCRDEFRLPAANHTFARKQWRDQVAEQTIKWLAEIRG